MRYLSETLINFSEIYKIVAKYFLLTQEVVVSGVKNLTGGKNARLFFSVRTDTQISTVDLVDLIIASIGRTAGLHDIVAIPEDTSGDIQYIA
jgi:hypothetical protein